MKKKLLCWLGPGLLAMAFVASLLAAAGVLYAVLVGVGQALR